MATITLDSDCFKTFSPEQRATMREACTRFPMWMHVFPWGCVLGEGQHWVGTQEWVAGEYEWATTSGHRIENYG